MSWRNRLDTLCRVLAISWFDFAIFVFYSSVDGSIYMILCIGESDMLVKRNMAMLSFGGMARYILLKEFSR